MLLKDILPHLLHQFPHESDLLKAIQELSTKFTTKREHIGDYLKDPRLTAAYTAFYLTTNAPKLAEVMKWMPQGWIELITKAPLIDLGAGPGTFSLAWREWAGDEVKEIWQIETSEVMRTQARKLMSGLFPEIKLHQSQPPAGGVLLFGHSANEMGPKVALDYIEKFKPEHILFIEPGTKEFFPKMLEIRRELIKQGFNVLYPCPSEHECPMAGDAENWCHQYIRVQQEPEVERLSQMAKKDRRLLPLIVHAYSKTYQHHDQERIVRVLPSTKFSFEWEVCLGERLERYQVMKRGLDKKAIKEIDEVLAGASMVSELDKSLEDRLRVKPIKINNKSY